MTKSLHFNENPALRLCHFSSISNNTTVNLITFFIHCFNLNFQPTMTAFPSEKMKNGENGRDEVKLAHLSFERQANNFYM